MLCRAVRLRTIVGDRGHRGLASLAQRKHPAFNIEAPPKGVTGLTTARLGTPWIPSRQLLKLQPGDIAELALGELGRGHGLHGTCFELEVLAGEGRVAAGGHPRAPTSGRRW